jgi:ADP-ribose pyrophosphatase YjhB (NUDIX family)
MAKVIAGERVGKQGRLAVGCSAAVFDDSRQRILLIRRVDNGRWAVPGGYMEAGESLAEACAREVLEETGRHVTVGRLISVFTNPHILLEYPDGNRLQLVVLHFEAESVSGELTPSEESSQVSYFTQAETLNLDLGELDRIRVTDSFMFQVTTIIRNGF